MDAEKEERVATEKWRALPERIDPSDMVETVDPDPQVEEIRVVNYGQEFIRIDHG